MSAMTDLQMTGDFPLVISPLKPVNTFAEFSELLLQHKEVLQALLLKHGALMLRGFPVTNAADFANLIKTLGLGNFVNYIGGDSPRDKVEEQVYTSTEAPPSFHIPLHQELSFIKNFPRHIYFFCEVAPNDRGETIIGDARKIYRDLNPILKERFSEKALTYTSNYYFKSKIMAWVNKLQRSHKSWTEVFETTSKEDVEKKCLANEFNWRWLRNDWLQIQQTRPAIINHPVTRETVWFNQIHLYDFSPRLLGWLKYLSAKCFYWRKSSRLHEISFSDATKVQRRDIYHVMDVLQENTVAMPWQAGDVMILDNVLAMHGRAPFSGKRRVLTAMTS
jgi:alpha-ketoglutarate-dependent taurine dioxygenase